MIAGPPQFTVGGELPGIRETQSNLNNPSLVDAVAESASFEGSRTWWSFPWSGAAPRTGRNPTHAHRRAPCGARLGTRKT
jgi:hypothetical protein